MLTFGVVFNPSYHISSTAVSHGEIEQSSAW